MKLGSGQGPGTRIVDLAPPFQIHSKKSERYLGPAHGMSPHLQERTECVDRNRTNQGVIIMENVVGIDIAKNTFDVATKLPNGKYRTKGKLSNKLDGFEQLHAWIVEHVGRQANIVMEATGIYHEAVAEYLYNQGFVVYVVNPRRIYHFKVQEGVNYKTDKIDSKLIAGFGAAEHQQPLRPWKPEPPARRKLRALLNRLHDLQEMMQMESNREATAGSDIIEKIRSHISYLKVEIKELEKAIKQHIDDDPEFRHIRDLLVTIDGIGEKTVATILAELGNPLEFDSPKSLVKFVGLMPRLNESGLFKGRSTITKEGSEEMRTALFMPALTALKYNKAIIAFATRLKTNGKAGKQIVCAVMSKLLHFAYGVLKSGLPFDAKIALAR